MLRRTLGRRWTVAAVLTAIVLTAGAIGVSDAPSASASSDGGALLADLNAARRSAGLAGLARAGDLSADAQAHAEHMAATGQLAHQSNLGAGLCCFRSLGENIGMGSDADAIHTMLMGSAPHRQNILGTWTDVGIGTARDASGRLWVTEVFRLRTAAAAKPSAAPAPPRAAPSHSPRPARPSSPPPASSSARPPAPSADPSPSASDDASASGLSAAARRHAPRADRSASRTAAVPSLTSRLAAMRSVRGAAQADDPVAEATRWATAMRALQRP